MIYVVRMSVQRITILFPYVCLFIMNPVRVTISDMNCLSRASLNRTVTIFSRQFHLTKMAPVAVGDKLPSINLFENDPGTKVKKETRNTNDSLKFGARIIPDKDIPRGNSGSSFVNLKIGMTKRRKKKMMV